MHDQDRPPALLAGHDDVVLTHRWHDHVTTRALKHALVYHELLVNTGEVLRRGDEVAVLIGDWRLDGLVVE